MKKTLVILSLIIVSLVSFAQNGLYYPSERLSNSLVSSLCQDKVGFIWVGTDYGLNRFDGYRFVKYFHNSKDAGSLLHNTVVSLYTDKEGRLWVGTNRGLQCYDYMTDSFETYQFPENVTPRVNDILQMKDGRVIVGTAGYGLFVVDTQTKTMKRAHSPNLKGSEMYFSHLYEDSEGQLWVSGTNRLSYVSKSGKINVFPPLSSSPTNIFEHNGKVVVVCRDELLVLGGGKVLKDYFDCSILSGYKSGLRTAFKDKENNIYLGSRGNGLFWIPAGTRKLLKYNCTVRGVDVNSTKIWAAMVDRSGNMWIGCQQRGLVMLPKAKNLFESWNFSDHKIDIGTFVSSISDSPTEITWCTVQDNGVYGFDETGNIVAHPSSPDGVEYLYRDSQNGYWLGTTHGMYAYDPYSGASKLVTDFPCYTYNTVTDDHSGHIFFSVFSKGMLMYDRKTKKISHFSMADVNNRRGRLCNDWILDLSTDSEHNVWAATSSGVCSYSAKLNTFRPYGWDIQLDGIACHAVCKMSNGDMLIGTECGLYIWKRKQNKVEHFQKSEPLNNLVVGYMVEDAQHNIWCSTSMGIWKYDVRKDNWSSYVNGNGLTSHEYVNSVGLHSDDERIFFATGNGITTFLTYEASVAMKKPGKVMLTSFNIEGIPVNTLTLSDGKTVTEQPVVESHRFELSYLDNSVSLDFSLLDFDDADNVVFEYRLDGSKEWSRTPEGYSTIALTQLSSGRYKLEVRAIMNGVTSGISTYTIVIRAPWYASTIAYLIYIILFSIGVVMIIYIYRRHVRQQMDEDKMKFLINATHDIRSPLTLILSPINKLKEAMVTLSSSEGPTESDRKMISSMASEISVIESNSKRILNLVNQILDVRKIDKQQMSLHCRATDMKKFLEVIYKIYEYPAKERGIDFRLEVVKPEGEEKGDSIVAWIDNVQFDKVVSNLLSNSLKYGNDNGEIVMRLSQGQDSSVKGPLANYVEISVKDEGMGMRNDTLQHLFERFYQEHNSNAMEGMSTGIGLNLCKMIVDMHHGEITAQNRTDGIKGSIFTVRIPLGSAHLQESEIERDVEKAETHHVKSKVPVRSNYNILLVDDDEEIGEYIARELGAYYHFAVAHNGKEGLKELLSNNYDLVVSDVMMPEMDGMTMLRMIKTNVNISHIPVIMLTSKSDVANRLEGLEKGADAYLTKPFTMEELHITIDNLIASHLRLRGKYSGVQNATGQVEKVEVKGNDEQLMERIIKSVNQHLSDSDYGVETMCEEVGISRAHLHRKMKDMAGIPVSEFIRNIRLEQAARLLKEQKVNITQVAYSVGFSSLGYFSTVFRKHFGVSPRDYVEQNEQQE